MEFNNIQNLRIQRTDDIVRVLLTSDDVVHMEVKTDLMECFESLNVMLTASDYPEKLKHFKDNR
jgi:hypothetical protein